MRITSTHRDHTTILAKCTKMKEAEHKIHCMNGISDSGNAAVKEETAQSTTAASDTYNNLGGRLKFFKNGRFILELARAREGEKVAWVPVPKKTFWPPQGSASSMFTYRQESSTSLSVSDDNSSVQSSPWQRDHTWKQASPQRNISTNLNFYFVRNKIKNKNKCASLKPCSQYKLQRAPFFPITEQQRTKCIILNNSAGKKCNNSKCVNSNNSSSAISSKKTRQTLVNVVQFLWNKSLQVLNSITSPRKRILRELERVTIDDLSIYNKRCRGKINQQPKSTVTSVNSSVNYTQQYQQQSSITSNVAVQSVNNNNDNPEINLDDKFSVNSTDNRLDVIGGNGGVYDEHQQCGVTSTIIPRASTRATKNSSYSITSLLGCKTEEEREENKIEMLPSSQYALRFTTQTSPNNSPIITSSANSHGHSYVFVDVENESSSMNTAEIMTSNKCSPSRRVRSPISSVPTSPHSPSTHYNYSPVTAVQHHQSQQTVPPLSHYMSPYSMYSSVLHHHPHHHVAANYIAPYYHDQSTATAVAYAAIRSAPPGFYQPLMPQSVVRPPLVARHEPQYSPPWTGYQHHQPNTIPKDDSDVPLNLSKDAD